MSNSIRENLKNDSKVLPRFPANHEAESMHDVYCDAEDFYPKRDINPVV